MLLKILTILSLLALLAATPTPSKSEEYSVRLPKTLSPTHYLVRVQPFINGNYSIHGFIEITFDVLESTDKIIFHIADVITHNETVRVYPSSGTPKDNLEIVSQEHNVKNELYIATMSDMLEAGKSYKIQMHYTAYLNGDLRGFYRSSYKNPEGVITWLAVTQFEPTDARRAFPCFDEPALKANYTIHIIRQNNMTSASNMPLKETLDTPDQDGWSTDIFETSVPMSSYLVAFLVSDYEHVIAENSSPNYKFGIWTRKEAVPEASYALKIAPDILRFYEDYFNVPFPLPKMDMVTVPDFSAGAMENWGLITYRDARLLYNPEVSTAADKKSIGSVIAHELAHQWFGDIVSPSWWTDLWLNEGFASYVEYIGLNAVEPEMRMMEQIVVNDRYTALALDCLKSSHPVRITVNHPDEINQIFDKISYQKGSSIIRMMNHFLTEDSFRTGLSNYLKELSYKAAEQDDLWRYLSEQAHADGNLPDGISVKDIMDTWTLQTGYPVIDVAMNDDGTVKLTQERFLLVEDDQSTEKPYYWYVPITFTTGVKPNFETTKPDIWMTKDEISKTVEVPNTDSWIIVNNKASGFYRVNYPEENWAKIATQLSGEHESIDNLNRAQLIDDSLNLARAGKLSYEKAFDILVYLKKEKDFMPIQIALNNLEYLSDMFSHTGGYGRLRNFLLAVLTPHYDEVKFEDNVADPHLVQLLRSQVLKWVCGLDYEPCVQKAKELYQAWMADPENHSLISPNLKSVVYCTAISKGGQEEWNFAWQRYEATKSSSEKLLLMKAMGCSSSEWILSEYLNRTLTPGRGIRKQDVRYILPAVAANTKGRLLAWEYIREHWRRIVDYFGSVSFTLDDILSGTTSSLNTRIQVQEAKSFLETNKDYFSSAFRAAQQAVEGAQNNRAWMKKYYEVIVNWLESNGYESGL